jgi:hypothetical protein
MPRSHALLTAILIICWLAGIQVVVALGWATNFGTLKLAPLISYLIVFAGFGVYAAKSDYLTFLKPTLAATLLILCTAAIAVSTDDFSYDGQDYQRDAIHAMVGGWNPFSNSHSNGASSIWVSHYAKGPWMVGASLSALTGTYEIAKCLNLLLLIAASLIVYDVCRNVRGMNRNFSILLATLVALNPVNSYQLFTGFVDSQVGSLVLILALLLYCYVLKRERILELALLASTASLITTKFSAALFVGILFAVFLLGVGFARNWRCTLDLMRIGAVGVGAGFLIGYNPFITNVVDHGHPFYPLAGAGSVNIVRGFVTDEFLNKNRLQKFYLSLASETHHDYGKTLARPEEQIRLKFPFAVTKAELVTLSRTTGPFIGGFGFWTSGALCLLCILCILKFSCFLQSENKIIEWEPLALLSGLLLSTLAFPESWWARYIPHFWAFLILASGFLLVYCRSRFYPLGAVVLAVLLINSTIVFFSASAHQIVQQLDYGAQVRSLKQISTIDPIQIKVKFASSTDRMHELGISFVQRQDLTCAHPQELIGGGATFCFNDSLSPLYVKGSPLVAALLRR